MKLPENVLVNCLIRQFANAVKAAGVAAGTTLLDNGTEYITGSVPGMELKLYRGMS